jgi:hypothetical protein
MILGMTKQGAGMRVYQHQIKNLPMEGLIIMGKREPFVFSEKRAILLLNSLPLLETRKLNSREKDQQQKLIFLPVGGLLNWFIDPN